MKKEPGVNGDWVPVSMEERVHEAAIPSLVALGTPMLVQFQYAFSNGGGERGWLLPAVIWFYGVLFWTFSSGLDLVRSKRWEWTPEALEEKYRYWTDARKASRRFAEENGMEGAGGFDGRVAKRPQSAAYDRLQESLLVGDTQGASVALADYMERFGKDDPAKAMRAISSSMRARQPLKVGVHTGEAVKQDFQDWARTHLSPERFAEFERVQETYTSTALALGLFFATMMVDYRTFSSMFRERREIASSVIPATPIVAGVRLAKLKLVTARLVAEPIGLDAKKGARIAAADHHH